jgi:hypothetical protein
MAQVDINPWTRSKDMRAKYWAALALSLASTPFALPAQAAVGDPLQVLYIIPGVRDDGGAAGTGTATAVHCTSFSSVTEKLQFAVLAYNGATLSNMSVNVVASGTRTAVTHDTNLYNEDLYLNTGNVDQGVVVVFATSQNVVCSAMTMAASATTTPLGFQLHGVRFNEWPSGTE